jgi:SWI/SNF related-matrix-associated actin-dependent regulator of chromatin subfamily C
VNASPRPVAMPGSMAEATVPAANANNMQGHGHPQMPFLQRQPQMLSFGPRSPLSAIQSQPSAQASNIMFSSVGIPNSAAPSQ